MLQRAQSKPEATISTFHIDDDDGEDIPQRPRPNLLRTQQGSTSQQNGPMAIPEAISHIPATQFDPVPDRGGGFSSTRISEILNFRQKLPPLVTVAHLHAVVGNPTTVERELAKLVKDGLVRKVVIPGRGTGREEALVLMQDLETLVKAAMDSEDSDLAERFLDLLKRLPPGGPLLQIPLTYFSANDIAILSRAGFFTSPSALIHSSSPLNATGDTGTLTSVASIARSASGSISAVGGPNALLSSGASGVPVGLRRSNSSSFSPFCSSSSGPLVGDTMTSTSAQRAPATVSLALSLPNTGAYLKFLTTSLSHLLSIIRQSNPYSSTKSIPLTLLRERWDGGVMDVDSEAQQAKKYRGEFVGALPARTRKWKVYWGVRCEWVLEEAIGRGLVERFQTGAVGDGVRIL